MKTTYAMTLCVLLLLFSACATKVNDPADVQAIKNLGQAFDKAEKAADPTWFTSNYYVDGAVRMPPHEGLITGKESIGKKIQMSYEKATPIDQTSPADEVLTSGDLAIARGKWTWTGTPKASGLGAINDNGKWAAAYQRQSDGSWKCVFDIWNSDQPAPGNTASGEDENALYQLERDWAAANPKKDAAVLEKILANEFVFNADGQIQNKKQAMAEIRNNPAKIESGVNSDMKAMVFGDTAVVHGVYAEKSTTNGKDTSKQVRWTDVFVKREGRWLCVTSYVTKASATP